MIKLVRFLKDYKKQVILGPIFKLIEAIFELIVPLVMARVIDVGVKQGDKGYIFRMGGIMLLLAAVGLCSTLVCQYFAARASQGFGTTVRAALYRHVNSLSYAELDKLGVPSLITRVTNDVNQLQVAVAMLIRLVVRAPFLAVGAIVMAMSIDLTLSLVFLAAAPLIALVLYFVMSRSVPLYKAIQKKLDRLSLISRENLDGTRVIRAFSKQKNEERRFREASEDLAKASVRVGKISALLNPANYLILNFAIVAIVWFGGFRVNEGRMTQGQMIAFVNYMTQILLALVVVANLVVIFTRASASAARVNEVFETLPSVVETVKEPVHPEKGEEIPKIEFRNVDFAYPGSGELSLSGLSFSVMRGETVGIIGGTGAGKSTLVNLVPRFYDVTAGEVLVDGVNVKDYSFSELRGQIGAAPQKAMLFSGTVRENMSWRKPNASDAEISRALSVAQAAEFVQRLSEGLDTVLSQGGKNLSGGQRQRLTIARALVASPEILILDDSTSALDFVTDAALRRALKKETEGMTVLLVSQRVSTVRRANQILVLDEGHLVGAGRHEELLKECEVYREICLSQRKEEEVGEE